MTAGCFAGDGCSRCFEDNSQDYRGSKSRKSILNCRYQPDPECGVEMEIYLPLSCTRSSSRSLLISGMRFFAFPFRPVILTEILEFSFCSKSFPTASPAVNPIAMLMCFIDNYRGAADRTFLQCYVRFAIAYYAFKKTSSAQFDEFFPHSG